MNDKLVVGIADMKMAQGSGMLVTYALGSCIGICFYDPMLKLAALLHKGVSRDPTAVSARQALAMATVNGAKALGRNTGRIAPGLDADLILVDFTHPGLTPCHDPEENLVFSAHGSDVVMNMARGKVIYENGAFLTLDLEDIRAQLEGYALPRIFG